MTNQAPALPKALSGLMAFSALCFILFIIIPLIFWIISLIDILRNEFTGNNKIIWFLVVTFIPFIGPILYFFIGRKQKVINKQDLRQYYR